MATELDLCYCVFVSSYNSCNSCNFWGFRDAIQRKTMTYSVQTHESGDSTKAVDCEHLVVIVRLNNCTNLEKCGFVLVGWTHRVETVWRCCNPITDSVINRSCERKLPSWSEVVKEWWRGQLFEITENKLAAFDSVEHKFFRVEFVKCEGRRVEFRTAAIMTLDCHSNWCTSFTKNWSVEA